MKRAHAVLVSLLVCFSVLALIGVQVWWSKQPWSQHDSNIILQPNSNITYVNIRALASALTPDAGNPLFKDPDSTLERHWVGTATYWNGLYYWFVISRARSGSTGMTGDIRLATSNDTKTWTWQGVVYKPPGLGKVEAHGLVWFKDRWIMSTARSPDGQTPWRSGKLESTDLLTWSNDVEIFDVGEEGAWDDSYATDPRSVVWDGKIFTYYIEGAGAGYPVSRPRQVGLAISEDGDTWVKHDGPVLCFGAEGSWDEISCNLRSVNIINNQIVLTLVGKDAVNQWNDETNTFYAYSEDGVNFVKVYEKIDNELWNLFQNGTEITSLGGFNDGWGRYYSR